MNSIPDALKAAGVKLPSLKNRIWLWLKDHPGKNYKTVATALKATPSSVSSQLGDLYARGMLSCETVPSNAKRGVKSIKIYSALGREYELAPLPLKNSPCKTHTKRVPIDAPLIHIGTLPPLPAHKGIDVEQLTISEARALYRKLQEMFK